MLLLHLALFHTHTPVHAKFLASLQSRIVKLSFVRSGEEMERYFGKLGIEQSVVSEE